MLKNRKNIIRLILFLLAAALAVFSFTWGVVQMGHKDPGWQTIDINLQQGHILYRSGVTCRYWAAGSSAEIRALTENVRNAYTDSLLRNFQLLDADNTWDGVVNLASLNQHPGETLLLSDALGDMLLRALEKTEKKEGYSLLAGPLYREWQNLVYLKDPLEFDPLNSPEEQEKLRRITELLNRPDTARLSLEKRPEGYAACLTLSPEWLALQEELELTAPVLDLGLLHDALLIDRVAEDLAALGYTAGMLMTESGYARILRPGLSWVVSLQNRSSDPDVVTVSSPAASAFFAADLPFSDGYGSYSADGHWRHLWCDARTGGFADQVLRAALAVTGGTAEETAWQLIRLVCAPDPASLAFPGDLSVSWIPQSSPAAVITPGS